MEQAIQNVTNQMNNLDVDAVKENNTTTITITKKDGTEETTNVLDGEDGVGLNYNWSGTSLGVKREDESNYDYVNLQGPVGPAGAIKMLIVAELPETGQEGTLYFVPKQDTETGDIYNEYMWVNNDWELIGEKQIVVDLSNYYTKQETYSQAEVNALIPSLTDYVKNNDYATSSKGGVIKTGSGTQMGSDGTLKAVTYTYSEYPNKNNNSFISKGTLENVITGKGLVSNTDYATENSGGVIKVSNVYGTGMANGYLYGNVFEYQTYTGKNVNTIISKGTLENVLTARIGDISSAIDLLNGEVI